MRVMLRFLYGDGFDVQSMQRALELEDPRSARPVGISPQRAERLDAGLHGTARCRAHEQMGAMRRHYVDRGEESELIFIDFHCVLLDIWRGDFTEAARSSRI